MLKNVRTLTSRGRVTIPKEFRDELGLRPHDKIRFTVVDGEVLFEKVNMSQEEVAGSLKGIHMRAPSRKPSIRSRMNGRSEHIKNMQSPGR